MEISAFLCCGKKTNLQYGVVLFDSLLVIENLTGALEIFIFKKKQLKCHMVVHVVIVGALQQECHRFVGLILDIFPVVTFSPSLFVLNVIKVLLERQKDCRL